MWKCKATLYAARVMPEEIYFLSRRTNEANVKVRDGLLDIKTKVGETPEGYEIFHLAANLNSRLNGKSWAKSSSISKLRLN